MPKCPICGKNKSNKKDLLEHVESAHKNEIPNSMSAAQYVYFLNHGRAYGICRICGNSTPWNEKAGKPKQICGSDACKKRVSKEFEQNLKAKYNKTRQDLMNDPNHQEEMLANRKISGVYKWSDNKHSFTYTGSYEKFALEWLDKVMDIDPDTIQTPGPKIQYMFEGKLHYWITDMYLTDFNLVIEIKDGNGTGEKNNHPGFAHNRDLERAKDDYMRTQNQYNYIKLTNKNMIQLVKILSEIRLNNIFANEKNNKKTEPIIDINEYIEFDTNLISLDSLNESIMVEKITGQLKDLHLRIVELIKDVTRKWNNIKELNVSKKEKQSLLNIIKLSTKLINYIWEILEKEIPISYETQYEEFLKEIQNFKKYRKNGDEKNDKIKINILQNHLSLIQRKFKESSKIDSDVKFNKKYKTALYIVMSKTLYVLNLTLYNLPGKGSAGSFRSDKRRGIVSKRYGNADLKFNIKNMDDNEKLEILDKLRKSASYESYKKIFDDVLNMYNKKDVGTLKFLDMEKYNKLVFLSYGKLKPMVLKKGSKLYHISTCSTIKALNPVYKCRDNITFYSTPRIYFTDKIMDVKKVLPNVEKPSIYEYEVPKDMTAYRDGEYGSWYHHCLYVESTVPLKVKNITKEVMESVNNESINADQYYAYNTFTESANDINPDTLEKDVSTFYNNYKKMDKTEKENNVAKALYFCRKVIGYISGVGLIDDANNEIKNNKQLMKQLKTDMPMNHETYNAIKVSLNLKSILKMILGIIIIVLDVIIIGKISYKIIGEHAFAIGKGIGKISVKYKNAEIKNICKSIASKLSKIINVNIINENYDQYDIVDIGSELLNESNVLGDISNDDINALCEGTYTYNENVTDILNEVSFPFFSSKKNNKSKAVFSTYDIKTSTWKNLLFPKSNFIKKVTSIFHRVEINPDNHTIEIRGINYRRLIQHIKDLYPDQKVYKIFEIIYNAKDWDKYSNKKINKSSVRIDYIQTYEFFALELSILFKELYDKYKLNPYNEICMEIYNKTWLSRSDIIKPEPIDMNGLRLLNSNYELKPFQREFIELYPILKSKLNLNGYILSFDQGLGKTLTSIALALCLRKDKVYVVCPNALKENWSLEIKSYFPKYSNDEIWKEEVYVNGISENYDIQKTKFIIVNQESIPKIYDKIDSKSNNMLIVDESHNFRNLNSARSNNLVELKNKLKTNDTLVMSGTPIKASPNEICPVLKLIDPLFVDDVAIIYNRCFNMNDIVASNIIQTRFGKIMYRKTKDEVLELPQKHIDALKLKVKNEDRYYVSNIKSLVKDRAKELFKKEYKDYDSMKNEFHTIINKYSTSSKEDINKYLSIIDENRPNYEMHEMDVIFKKEYLDKYVYPSINDKDKERLDYLLVRFVNMWQHCIGVALGEILHPRRKELFMKLYDDNKSIINNMIFNNIKKTVIFTPIVDVAKFIHKSLQDAGLSSVLVTGETKDKLTPILRFKEDSNIDVLVATSQTLGTGVTLTEANLMFFFGSPWRSADFDQCCDRIYRIGQTNDVFIFNVLMDSEKLNLSTRMENILNWSNKMFGAMITSTDDETIKGLNESVIFSSDDLYHNVDKFENGDSNVLLVTGLSGSGKSTIGKQLSNKYKAEYIELDLLDVASNFVIEKNIDAIKSGEPIMYEFLMKNKKIFDKLISKNVSDDEMFDIMEKYIKYVLSYARNHKDKKFIIEGIQIFDCDTLSDTLVNYPIVIKGTSSVTSFIRKAKRDKWEMKDIIKNIPQNIKYIFNSEKKLNLFKKILNKSINSTNNESVMSVDIPKNLYFLSFDNMDNKILTPRIPDNFFTQNGYEDNTTKRVCLSTSIDKCLMALSMNLNKKELYIHVPIGSYDIYKPSTKEVPDCDITGEVWIKKPVRIKTIGKIKVKTSPKNGIKFKYGNNKEAELYPWDYEWIEKYDTDFQENISSNESVMSVANLSPIVKTGLFEELKPNEDNEDFDKQLELLKKSLNESLKDIPTINPKDYCPEYIDFNDLPEDRFLMNRVKADIVNKTAITVTVDRHYGNLYVASDFHIFGVWDKNDNNNNATNIQQVNRIIDDINSKVKEDDTLIICGDLGYKLDDCLLPHTKYFLQSIRCKHIWLVVGNHDLLTNDQYKEFGCEIVCDRLEYNGWIFTHYPINTNKFNFYGHLHNEKLYQKTGDYKNMSTDNRYNCFYYINGITNVKDVIDKYLNNSNMIDNSMNEEAIYTNIYKYPVFIILMHSGTVLADAIKKFTHDDYSHACISLTPDLVPMYSFGRKKVDLKDGTGFCISSPTDDFFKKFKAVYAVYVMYLSKNEYDNIKKRLQYFIDNKDVLKYNISALIMNALNKPTEKSKKYFCSRFVADVLNSGRTMDKLPSLYRPNDFAYRSDITLVNSGTDISKYNKNITLRNLKLIQKGLYSDINLVETSLKDSDVMFGNGEYTAITDNRFTDFQTGNPFEQNEDIDPYTATFSPNNDKPVQDYMDASNNFETNEDVRVDMEVDPAISGPNTFASLSQSIYNSNFEI